ncbi:YkoF-like protein [Suillus paluster]|uniref:YkoF-like protein n=1 Tax=Suillus paluster TaxID=48578 RepID=UPI001B860F12|nr:YkoF-like protein [Suillus paluster]KAG1724956.1 YkoF-like protein [Suillus paluster]
MTTNMPNDLYAVADFCLIPIGTGESSVAEYIAECHRVLEKSGLTFKDTCLSGYATNHEGPRSEVSKAIHDCHAAVHAKGAPRVATDIRIGTRVDRDILAGDGNDHKVRRVEEILARDRATAS